MLFKEEDVDSISFSSVCSANLQESNVEERKREYPFPSCSLRVKTEPRNRKTREQREANERWGRYNMNPAAQLNDDVLLMPIPLQL